MAAVDPNDTPASEPQGDEEDEIADSSPGGGVGPLELRRIGKYRIGDKTLGTGQFCTVKVGYHEGRKVALKIVKPKWAKQDSDAVNEMKMLRRVTHKNVIRLIDGQLMVSCPKKDGTTFETDMLVLELAEATLSEILFNTGKFEEPFARACFRQLIEGIEKCHEMGVVHRDLKPEQLLVCTEDKSELKIADFGLGKMYPLPEGMDAPERDSKSVHHGIVDAASVGEHAVQLPICRYWADKDDVGGTPAFMAPEVFALWKEDEPTKDLLDAEATELLDRSGYPEGSVPLRGYDCVPVDVWGCALVLFWLLAGTHPFNLRTRPCQWWFKRVMNRDRSAFWEYVNSQGLYFSLGVQDLINKMLHPEPLKRMTLAEIKSHAWYLDQVPTQTALRSELEDRLSTTLKNKRLEMLQREKEEKEAKELAAAAAKSPTNASSGSGDSAMERLRAHKAREAKLKEGKAAQVASRVDDARKERLAAEKQKEERRAEQQRKLRELQDARKQRQADMKEKAAQDAAKRASSTSATAIAARSGSGLTRPGSASLTRDAAKKLTRDFSRSGPVAAPAADGSNDENNSSTTNGNDTPRAAPTMVRRGSVDKRPGSRNGSRAAPPTPTTPGSIPKGGIPRRATLPSGGIAPVPGPLNGGNVNGSNGSSSSSSSGTTANGVSSPTAATPYTAPRPGSSQGIRRMSTDNRKGSAKGSTPRGTSTTISSTAPGATTQRAGSRVRSASRDGRTKTPAPSSVTPTASRGHSRVNSRDFAQHSVPITVPRNGDTPSATKTADLLASFDPQINNNNTTSDASLIGVSSDAQAVSAALRRLELERAAANGDTPVASSSQDGGPAAAIKAWSETKATSAADHPPTSPPVVVKAAGGNVAGISPEKQSPRLTAASGTTNGRISVGRPSTGSVAPAPGSKNIVRRGSTGMRGTAAAAAGAKASVPPPRLRDPSPAFGSSTPTHASGVPPARGHKRNSSIGSNNGDRTSLSSSASAGSGVRATSRDPRPAATTPTTTNGTAGAAPAKRSFAAFSAADGAAVAAVATSSSSSGDASSSTGAASAATNGDDATDPDRPPFVVPLETRSEDEIRREERRADAQRKLDDAVLNGGVAPPPGSMGPAKRRSSASGTTPRSSLGSSSSLLGSGTPGGGASKRKEDGKSREDKLKDHRAKEKALRDEQQARLAEKEAERKQRRVAEDRARELKRRELQQREQRRRDEVAEAQRSGATARPTKERLALQLEEEQTLALAKKRQLVEAKLARIRQMQDRLEQKRAISGSLTHQLLGHNHGGAAKDNSNHHATTGASSSPHLTASASSTAIAPLPAATSGTSTANGTTTSSSSNGGTTPGSPRASTSSSVTVTITGTTGSNGDASSSSSVALSARLATPAHGVNGGQNHHMVAASPFSTALDNISHAVSSLASPEPSTTNQGPAAAAPSPLLLASP